MPSKKSIEFVNCYELMNVAIDASDVDIRKAYRKLALQLHPDRNKDKPDTAERFDKMVQAYNTLSDAKKRKEHNKELKKREADKMRLAEKNASRRRHESDLTRREALFTDQARREAKMKATAKEHQLMEAVRDVNKLKEQYEDELKHASRIYDANISSRLMPRKEKPVDSKVSDDVNMHLKVKWSKSKGDEHTVETLHHIFKPYGVVENIIIGGKKGSTAMMTIRDKLTIDAILKDQDDLSATRGLNITLVGDNKSSNTTTNDDDGIANKMNSSFVYPSNKRLFPYCDKSPSINIASKKISLMKTKDHQSIFDPESIHRANVTSEENVNLINSEYEKRTLESLLKMM